MATAALAHAAQPSTTAENSMPPLPAAPMADLSDVPAPPGVVTLAPLSLPSSLVDAANTLQALATPEHGVDALLLEAIAIGTA